MSNSIDVLSFSSLAASHAALKDAHSQYNNAIAILEGNSDVEDESIPAKLTTMPFFSFSVQKLSRFISKEIAPMRFFDLESHINEGFSGRAVLPDDAKDEAFFNALCKAIADAQNTGKEAHDLLSLKHVVSFIVAKQNLLNTSLFIALNRTEKHYIIPQSDTTDATEAKNIQTVLDLIGAIAFTKEDIEKHISDASKGADIQNPMYAMKKTNKGVKVTFSDMTFATIQGNMKSVHFAQMHLQSILKGLKKEVISLADTRAKGSLSKEEQRRIDREARFLRRKSERLSA